MPTPSPLQEALRGRYRIERELGRGGMATVYLAGDLKHNRLVALKVLHPDLAASLGPERFDREIKLAARLQHPHILPVFDSGVGAGLLWYTMPYVVGESLRDRLTRVTQLPLDEAIRIGREVALALDCAHRHGIIHRDIKPENILLSEGQALVADFGIARAVVAVDDAQVTEAGIALGTPAYMSPEQSTGDRKLDGRSDIYSLGCMLYEMLAGEPPYQGPTPQAIFAKRFTDPVPSVRRVRPSIPVQLERVLLRALALVPADRFPSAAAFSQALEPVERGVANAFDRAGQTSSAAPHSAAGSVLSRLVHRPMFVAVLTVMLLIVAAVWLAGLRGRRLPHEGEGPKLVAVLPFENMSRAEDDYLADGMTDAVRGKLAGLPGLQVIARGSSTQYKGTSKSPREIARELGVEYLLTGTVRRQRDQNGAGRIQVTPELVQVTGVRVPTTRWQEPFDAVPNNVFQVQADIASRVAQSLGVALGEGERHALAERPTRSVKAYDAYLRAEAVGHGIATSQPTALRRAAAAYEEAVALDPTFALAWAKLSRAYSMIYYLVEASSIIAERARTSAEKALDLAPTLVEARIAYGEYFVHVKKEARRALAEYALASRSSPNDAFLLTALAHAEQVLGRWESGIEHLQQAQRLDPRSVPTAQLLAETFFLTRRYPEALAAADRGIALAPDNLLIREQKAMVYLAQGDLEGARQVIRAIPPEIEPEAVVAYLAAYADLFWLLDDQQQRLLLRLGPERFDNNRASWGLCLAQTYALRGDWGKARAYADSAAIVAEAGVRAVPDDGQGHGLLGLILAYAGRLEKAIEEGERGVALVPIAKDAYLGPYIQHLLVRIYLLADQPEKALDRLEPLLRVPYYLTPKWLEIDPAFDRVRRNQRFQGILERAAAP